MISYYEPEDELDVNMGLENRIDENQTIGLDELGEGSKLKLILNVK